MDIKEIREKKKAMEMEILFAINRFENDTKLSVDYILHDTAEIRPGKRSIVAINCEVKI